MLRRGGVMIVESQIIEIRERPDLLEQCIDYFASRWGIDRRIYADSISHSLTTDSPLPRWYLVLAGNKIIGSYGLITNDFISRQDLVPWLCALYVEKEHRGKNLGAKLLGHGRREAAVKGYEKLYLCTSLEGYYERLGWKHIGSGVHPWGNVSKIYEIETSLQLAKER